VLYKEPLFLLANCSCLSLQVLSVMGDNPVIFAPSHRSYGDFILMSYICFHYKIQIPAIAAGMGMQIMRVIELMCAIYMYVCVFNISKCLFILYLFCKNSYDMSLWVSFLMTFEVTNRFS
jgi:hypothetical protein